MFKKINSENLLWLINGEEPMPADKTVHKLLKNGERELYKDNKEVCTLPLKEAMSQFLGFVSRSVERAKSRTNKNVVTVLLGHNSLTFDVPVLLRNSESAFKERLQAMDVFFADSLKLFKTLVRENVSF